MKAIKNLLNMYSEGFKNMSSLGKRLWIIIFIKLFIMFAILKVFFFPNYLNSKFDNKEEKSEYVIEKLIK
ncbi:MAG TPA: DUF4492 domain-containing protein [Bacteroidetes bacterium]|nr:DUF4492 domain-containing protein [Bacteroidota bacterium]